jgi:hypothetical protein
MPQLDKFEYDGLLVTYDVELNCYYLTDMNYMCPIGRLRLDEGPGWVLAIQTTFLDGHEMQTIANMIAALNEDIA